MSTEVLDTIKADKAIQAGDVSKIIALVDTKVMPHVNFQRMTASAVGRYWRQATPEQQKRLQEEFKTLLVRTYAGALTQVKDQTGAVEADARQSPKTPKSWCAPRSAARANRSSSTTGSRRQTAGWKIYDVNVLGVWLVEQYRNSFAQEIGSKGIDGLIANLAEKNKAAARS